MTADGIQGDPPERSDIGALERAFHEALARPPSEREAWLTRESGLSAAQVQRVRALLIHHREDDQGFTVPRSGGAEPAAGRSLPERIGPYRVKGELGRGGMGRVFLAEREGLGRQVALKVVSGGPFLSAEAVRRFESEQRILARLQHPGIATLFDAGVSGEGTPYFAMEHVDGAPITHFADARGVDLTGRLELFGRLCEAVAYAHRNLVLHRDIKPSNVLVSDTRQVKLLDFGVAKLLDESGSVRTTQTRVFTPSYASPEQIRGERASTATDVYQLGVVLYELLCGVPPFSLDTLTPADALRVIEREEPPLPSKRTGAGATAPPTGTFSIHRSFARRVGGDLDRVVLKCLEKAPDRRYPSVDALLDDLRRFHEGRPVAARPGGGFYRARKFVLRNRALSGAAVFGVLYVATLMSQNREIRLERDRAADAAEEAALQNDRAQTVSSFLLSLFQASDPGLRPDSDLTARELLAVGVSRADSLSTVPQSQAAVLTVIGRSQHNLGLFDDAGTTLRRAVTLLDSLADAGVAVGEDHDLATLGLAYNLSGQERHDEAEQWYRKLVERRGSDPSNLHLHRAMRGLGNNLHARGKRDEALEVWAEWEALVAHGSAPRSPELAGHLRQLGLILNYSRELERAEAVLREAQAMFAETLGEDHPETVRSWYQLAELFYQVGDTAGADTASAIALRGFRDMQAVETLELCNVMATRARVLELRGSMTEAEQLIRESLDISGRLVGEDGPFAMHNTQLAALLAKQERFAEAERRFQVVADWWDERHGPDYVLTLLAEMDVAWVWSLTGRSDEARALWTDIRGRLVSNRGEDDRFVRMVDQALEGGYWRLD